MTSFDLNPTRGQNPGAAAGSPDAAPKAQLHVDSDWKAQAQAEKERLAKQEQERSKDRRGPGGAGAEELPPADFRALVDILASQALGGLGAYGDSKTGRVIVDLVGARFGIDLLGVLEEKTKGNLTDEEAHELREILAGLRSRYVHFHDLVTRQQAAATVAAAGGAVPGVSAGTPRPPAAGGPTLHVP